MKPTDWAKDIVDRFKEVSVEDGEQYVDYRYTKYHCALCRLIVEPIALDLAAQDDWLALEDVKALTGYQITTPVAAWELIGELHPDHPSVREDGHLTRLEGAARHLHSEMAERVRAAVDAGEVEHRVLHSIERWFTSFTDSEAGRVDQLIAAHHETGHRTKQLAAARQRRRELAVHLHLGGRSYTWIGRQIGLTGQAVEGFVKYHQRRKGDGE